MTSIHQLDLTTAERLAFGFGKVVRRVRRARRITQAQLAEAVGVTQAAISLVENGKMIGLSMHLAGDLCDILDIHAEWHLAPPFLTGPAFKDDGRQRDAAHARCSGYVRRRLERAGWEVRQEVEVRFGRSHGFTDASGPPHMSTTRLRRATCPVAEEPGSASHR